MYPIINHNNFVALNAIRRCNILLQCPRRFKKKKIHWSLIEKRQFPTDKALAHFDDFYQSIFRVKWPSVRTALLSPHKYVALVNNFGDVEETQAKLTNLGAVNIKTIFDMDGKRQMQEVLENVQEKEKKKVFSLEDAMGDRTRSQEINELNLLYPDGSGDKIREFLFHSDVKDSEEKKKEEEEESEDPYEHKSLYSHMAKARYDSQRVIDPSLGVNAGAINEFMPATKLKGLDDYVGEAEYYNYYKSNTDLPVNVEKEYKLNYPEHLKVFSFYRGDMSSYPRPKLSSLNVLEYYLLNGASILPVLALGINPGDTVLDMCAGPGGKSLTAFQTLYPKLLVCNDTVAKRVKRISTVFSEYIDDFNETDTAYKDMIMITQRDGARLEDVNLYDKILVDVPCTNDRLSLEENEENIFQPNRIKERLRLPEIQSALLTNALKLVRPGGTVVYSTCTLSPIQNDGVVFMALRRVWEETKIECTVVDLAPALTCTSTLFNYGQDIGLRYGHLIVPFLPSNFGPMYFCKIVKN